MNYHYHTFVHLVPAGYTIPKDTQIRLVNSTSKHTEETFFTTLDAFTTPTWEGMTYYLDYDITKPKLPTEINSVIYNVRRKGVVYPIAVYQGPHLWSAFNNFGERRSIFSSEIEAFDTTPSTKEED